jgi:hypothetical protein
MVVPNHAIDVAGHTASTRFAPTCWRWPETTRPPSRTTGLPRAEPFRSSAT